MDRPPNATRGIYGRDRECTKLRSLLDDAVAGHGSLVLISGEAGIGKTALVDDLTHEAEQHSFLVLTGGCYDLTTTPPYGPWAEAMRGYQSGENQPPLPAWFGSLEELRKVGSQAALFEAVREILAATANTQPVLLVLEDLHWSDVASLDMLRYLSRSLGDSSILIVATYRDDEITRRHHLFQMLPSLLRESGAHRLFLTHLDDDALHDLITIEYDFNSNECDRLRSYLSKLSEGNPLYARELVQALEDDRIIQRSGDRHTLGELVDVTVPPLIKQVIERRLMRQNPETIELLEIAAVIGQEFDFAIWEAIGSAESPTLLEAIEASQRIRLIEEIGRSGRYRFRHALIREALYERLVWPVRRGYHQETGRILTSSADPDPDLVAYHFIEAKDDRAVEWLKRASDRAAMSWAWLHAVDRLERAGGLLEESEDSLNERARLLFQAGQYLLFADPPKRVAYLDEAIRLAERSGDHDLVRRARAERAVGVSNLGLFRESIAELELARAESDGAALDDVAGDTDEVGLGIGVASDWSLANLYWTVGRIQDARQLSLQLDRRNSAERLFADITLGRCHYQMGQPHVAREAFLRARDVTERTAHPMASMSVALSRQWLHLAYFADNVEARSQLEADQNKANALAQGVMPHEGEMGRAFLYLVEGDWESLEQQSHQFNAIQSRVIQQATISWLAELYRYRGDTQRALEQVMALHPQGAGTQPGNCVFIFGETLQRIAADLCLDDGDLEGARAWLEAHDRWMAWSGAVLGLSEGRLGWARCYRVAGDPAMARQYAKSAHAHASDPRQPLALIAADRFLGQLDVDTGKWVDAKRHLDASLELAERCAAPFEQALTLVVLAERAANSAEIEEAQRLLARVRNICEPLGAQPTLDRADQIESMLTSVPRRNPSGLTPREVEVLQLVAQGMTDAEAAEQLFLSPRTVSSYLSSVYNKLGVNSRTAAVSWAAREGLVN